MKKRTRETKICRALIGATLAGGAKPRTERCRNRAASGGEHDFCLVHAQPRAIAPDWWMWPEELIFRVSDLLRRNDCGDAERLILNLRARIDVADVPGENAPTENDVSPLSADMAVLLAALVDAPFGTWLVQHHLAGAAGYFAIDGRPSAAYAIATVTALARRGHLKVIDTRKPGDRFVVVTAYVLADLHTAKAAVAAPARTGTPETAESLGLLEADDTPPQGPGIFGSGL